MKVGDKVRVLALPPGLKNGDLKTRTLFQKCVGRVFPIVGFQNELIELEVGKVVGKPSYYDTIWIEPEFVELYPSRTKPTVSLKRHGSSKSKKAPAAKRRKKKAPGVSPG